MSTDWVNWGEGWGCSLVQIQGHVTPADSPAQVRHERVCFAVRSLMFSACSVAQQPPPLPPTFRGS